MRMENKENWRRLQLLTRAQPLLIYTWQSRLQRNPEPHQLKEGQIIPRTDTTVHFCVALHHGDQREARLTAAQPWHSSPVVPSACSALKALKQSVSPQPDWLKGKLRCQWIVLVILPCALSPPHIKLAWEHQETADGHQKHHQITTGLAWIMWPRITHSQQTVWLEKSGNTRRMCWSLYEFSNSPY